MNPSVTAATRDQLTALLDIASNDRIRGFLGAFDCGDPDAMDSARLRREALLVLVESVLDGAHTAASAVAVARGLAS